MRCGDPCADSGWMSDAFRGSRAPSRSAQARSGFRKETIGGKDKLCGYSSTLHETGPSAEFSVTVAEGLPSQQRKQGKGGTAEKSGAAVSEWAGAGSGTTLQSARS